jgi:hypothetical protein
VIGKMIKAGKAAFVAPTTPEFARHHRMLQSGARSFRLDMASLHVTVNIETARNSEWKC